MQKIPAEEYMKMVENLPIVCIDIVLTDGKRALLVKRSEEPAKGLWWLPGGRLLKNERLEERAVRKAKEETGIDAKVVRRIGVYETFFDIHSIGKVKGGYHTVNIGFLLTAKNSDVELDETSSSFRWIESIEEGLDPYVKKVLGDSGIWSR